MINVLLQIPNSYFSISFLILWLFFCYLPPPQNRILFFRDTMNILRVNRFFLRDPVWSFYKTEIIRSYSETQTSKNPREIWIHPPPSIKKREVVYLSGWRRISSRPSRKWCRFLSSTPAQSLDSSRGGIHTRRRRSWPCTPTSSFPSSTLWRPL